LIQMQRLLMPWWIWTYRRVWTSKLKCKLQLEVKDRMKFYFWRENSPMAWLNELHYTLWRSVWTVERSLSFYLWFLIEKQIQSITKTKKALE
jgi:hypothetical protein